MNTSPRLLDHVIGEAALSLLRQKKPISVTSLLAELSTMSAASADRHLKNACTDAISWIEEDYPTEGVQNDVLNKKKYFRH